MKCPRCQREVNNDNQFCPYCGARLHKNIDSSIKMVNELRKTIFVKIINRILNISSIVALLFAVIGIFGPALTIDGTYETIHIGGFSWFIYEGWNMLNNGQLSIGPFYTTFALYILTFIAVTLLASHGIYKNINALRKRGECTSIPHIIALTIIHRFYISIINNFYYEKIWTYTSSYTTGSGWGENIYNFTIPYFTIALIILIIVKAVFTRKKRTIVSTIFATLSAFLMMNTIRDAFTTLGFQDLNIGEQDVFGTLHYFDVAYHIPPETTSTIFIMFALGLIYIGLVIALALTTIRNLIKYQKIDRKLFLILAIAINATATLMIVDSVVFSFVVNNIEGFSDNIFFLTESLVLLFVASHITLGFAIANISMGEDKYINESIIDQEVIDKDLEA